MIVQPLHRTLTVSSPFTANPAHKHHAFYIGGTGTISAGAIQIETAPSVDYAGTWAAIGSAQTLVSGATLLVTHTGPLLAIRARLSTAITGGGAAVLGYLGN